MEKSHYSQGILLNINKGFAQSLDRVSIKLSSALVPPNET